MTPPDYTCPSIDEAIDGLEGLRTALTDLVDERHSNLIIQLENLRETNKQLRSYCKALEVENEQLKTMCHV